MKQSAFSTMNELFLQFYETVARNHPHKLENYQKLRKKLTDDDTMGLLNTSQTSFGKKESRATKCSLTEEFQNLPSFQNKYSSGNNLFLTFGPNSHISKTPKSRKTMQFRYQNSSLNKTILYAIIFTHFHVETIAQKPIPIAHIFNLDQTNTKKLGEILQEMQIKNKKIDSNSSKHSLQPLINLISGFSFARQKRLSEDLKSLVDDLSLDHLEDIFQKLGNTNSTSMKMVEYLTKTSLRSLLSDSTSENREWQNQTLNALAMSLKIRITLEDQNGIKEWGKKSSKIRYLIKRDCTNDQYYLGDIFFYREPVRDKVQNSRA